jgi:hypothetical protein
LELGTGETHGQEEFDDGWQYSDHGLTMAPFGKPSLYRNPRSGADSGADLGFINYIKMNIGPSRSESVVQEQRGSKHVLY